MADFEPKTTIHFIRSHITDTDKVYIPNMGADNSGLLQLRTYSNVKIDCNNYSFQRADGYYLIRVAHDTLYSSYYNLLKCDAVIYLNEEVGTTPFYIFGNILGVEWKNPDCSFVRFKIDWFMTFQGHISWTAQHAFVEREHVKNDWSGSGNPLFANIGPAEDFNVTPDTPHYITNFNYDLTGVLIQSPYDDSGKAVFNGTLRRGLYSALQNRVFLSVDAANAYLTKIAENDEASINNIVGLFGVPNRFASIIENGGSAEESFVVPAINKMPTVTPVTYRNAKCWSGPYYTIRLTASNGDSKDFNPQWFGNDIEQYELKTRMSSVGGMFAGLEATLVNNNGTFNNWTGWADFTVSINELPSLPWTGDGFTDWSSRNMDYTVTKGIAKGLSQLSSGIRSAFEAGALIAATGGLPAIPALADTVSAGMNIASTVAATQATIKNQKATGAVVDGGGSYNALMDVGFNQWGFSITVYGTQQYIMQSIDSYFDRFGYRINKTKNLALDNRKYWTYLKTKACHVNGDGIPYVGQMAMNAMFDGGVTMWSITAAEEKQIGNFSLQQCEANRGIS